MLFTEQEADTILNNPKNLVNKFERDSNATIKTIKHGNGSGKRSTFEEQVLVGTLARAGLGSGVDIAKEFNLDPNTVCSYKAGRTKDPSAIGFKPHPELEERIKGQLDIVQEKAVDVLLRSLGVITDDKLNKLGAKDASSVAANASKIIQNCAPQIQNDNSIKVVMYAPKQKVLKDFDVVDI